MTECERFVSEGIISPDFFKEEVRCDFLVTTERKKIWAVELDLLRQFNNVCRKHGLTYFAFVGTLLGAIRHKGFIPWDDDIDLAMPRDDYEKMVRLGQEFKAPYFLQTPWTDENYFYSFAKIRNSNTSCVSEKFMFADFNQGLMLDFHPIDDWDPQDGGEEIYAEINKLAYDNSTYMRIGNPNLREEDKKRVAEYKGMKPIDACARMRELGMSWHGQSKAFVCRNTFGLYGYTRNLFYADDFKSTIDVDFEGFKISVPIGYDRILRTLYGEYNNLPPIGKRGSGHEQAIVNPDVPWREIIAVYRERESFR